VHAVEPQQQHPAVQLEAAPLAAAEAQQPAAPHARTAPAALPPHWRWDFPTAAHPAAPRSSVFSLQGSRWVHLCRES
jgi:hypothetical protein